MDRMLTRKLATAARVQEFVRAHPMHDRHQATVVAQFEARLAQAQALFVAEHKERLAAAASGRRPQDLRRRVELHLLPSVERIGAFAMRGDGQVAQRFTPPPRSRSHAAFVTRASNLLEVARAHQEPLIRHGVPRAQIAELASGLSEFRAATVQAQVSRQRHHDTRAKLERAVVELVELLQLLDAYNRVRFQQDAELLRRWTALRTFGRPATTRASKRGGQVANQVPPAPVAGPSVPAPADPSPPASAGAPGGDGDPPRADRTRAAA